MPFMHTFVCSRYQTQGLVHSVHAFLLSTYLYNNSILFQNTTILKKIVNSTDGVKVSLKHIENMNFFYLFIL